MARIALLSNPRSSGNKALLPRVRNFCAEHKDIFHYEVEHVDQVGDALKIIARIQPKVLVINGGDGTVQAALTELYHGGHFGPQPPPVAVLPNGKTNLIALDLGADGDPLESLKRVLEIVKSDMNPYIVSRELIALSDGRSGSKQVLGMFVGGAGLADIMLYCRHKIYPLGLPNGISHMLTAFASILSIIFGLRANFLPPRPGHVHVSVLKHGQLQGQFALLMVTTLERLLMGKQSPKAGTSGGIMQLVVIERSPLAVLRVLVAAMLGKLWRKQFSGIYMERGDEIRIEGDRSSVIFDGEMFEARQGHPIVLKGTAPVPFVRLAV